ncbi:MAG: hypothetical protein R2911_14060 [Caldilineaceae bacterium]
MQPHRADGFRFPKYAQAADGVEAHAPISLDWAGSSEPKMAFESRQISAPIYEIFSLLSPELTPLINRWQPDAACVACFPQRIPPALLKLPKHGFFNVHLPFYPRTADRPRSSGSSAAARRPRRAASPFTAWMPILTRAILQRKPRLSCRIAFRAGRRERCAQKGKLLAQVLDALAAGKLISHPQPAGGSYQSWPQRQDFRLDTNWPARRAFNFMRGAAEWGISFAVDVGNEHLHLQQAIAYDSSQILSAPILSTGDSIVQIQFAPGVLVARKA